VEERGAGRRLARSTAIFSLATGLSRALGLVREIVVNRFFGIEGPINAFTVAFLLPNTIRSLVADAALAAAFVPVFSELLEKGERAHAWRVASTLFWLMLLGLSAVTALAILAAPLLIAPFDLPAEYDDLGVRLTQILFPIVTLLGVSGVIVGILNSYEHFAVPALTPVFWNLAIIGGLAIGVPRVDTVSAGLYVYAAAVVVGTVVQVLLPVPWLRGRDGRLRVLVDVRDPAVKQVFVLMLPVMLGLGLINFNQLIGTVFASRYIDPNIAPRAIESAFRLYMLPQGMFSVAVATVLFPALSRAAARGDVDGLRGTVSTGMRQIAFLLLPATAVSIVLAEPIVRLLFERGEFAPDQTPVVAAALAAFSVGLVFNGMMLMLNRAFFALQLPRIPTYVAAGNLVFNTLLFALLFRLGTWGIPLAISIANAAAVAALLLALRRRLGRIDFDRIAAAFVRIALACVPVAVVAWGVWRLLDAQLGRTFPEQLAALLPALLGAALAYLAASRLLGVREMQALLSLRARSRRP
jgi:putative peptidoglycan lipid II flippase